ncbi:hypothetical protein D2A34_12545 [Clostridium chromiireducens]|uniref:J domain-containing protein n=1 Tax=Clostridium chromiireducens TaxID=225345 RepID=A0A399ILN6_9CLOT|nr:hypothetical protein D2A34_12545 [Clostridium chromiireducens]
MFNVDEILGMKYPYELFTGDKDIAKKEHINLLKMFHPDLHKDSEKYKEAASKINELYTEAIKLLVNGNWIGDGLIKITSSDGEKYSMKYNVQYSFELGKYYIGNRSILYLIDKVHLKFIDNALDRIKNLKYENNNMKFEFEKYFPKVSRKFETIDGKIGILIEKSEDAFSLKDILSYYSNKVPPRHVTWILSSLYNIACFLYYNNLSHNGLTIDNYFISPSYHNGFLLGGWWYTVPLDGKMLGVSNEIYNIMSPDMKSTKKGTFLLDLESIRLIGRTLLGDKNGIDIIGDPDIPKPLIDCVRGVSVNNPIEEYKLWDKVINESYGARKFIEMNIDKDKLYTNKI